VSVTSYRPTKLCVTTYVESAHEPQTSPVAARCRVRFFAPVTSTVAVADSQAAGSGRFPSGLPSSTVPRDP